LGAKAAVNCAAIIACARAMAESGAEGGTAHTASIRPMTAPESWTVTAISSA
jgi:hypothetical protein